MVRTNKNILGLLFKQINQVVEYIPEEYELVESIMKYVNEL